MTVSEEQVYLSLKRYVVKNGGYLLGGQPPSGTDHLPVIEIRSPDNSDKGSKSSFKPDLVFELSGLIHVVEIKPSYSPSDRSKQLELLRSPERIDMFWHELRVRKISSPHYGELYQNREHLQLAIGLAFEGEHEPDRHLWLICGNRGDFLFVPPSGESSTEARR